MPSEKDNKLDLNYIQNIVQQILDKSHTVPEKRIIKRYPNEQNPTKLNFACPICGDSSHKMTIKRGHLHLSNLYYVCYNERETDSMSFSRLCKYFNIELDPEKRLLIYNYLDNNWKYTSKDDFAIDNMDKLLDFNDFFSYIKEHSSYLINVRPITKGSIQWNYLNERKIYNYDNIWEGIYKITDKWYEPVIVMLNRTSDKLLGIQLRNLKSEKIKRIYKFISFQELYNMRFPKDNIDEIEAISYNKLSSIFNILNVNFEDTIYVFEGYLDSIFFPNSISLVGLDTDISMFSNENLDMKFIFDNDNPGQRKAKEMLENNFSVFLWKRFINDASKGKGSKLKSFLTDNCKDINKLVEFYKDPNIYNNMKLNNYFARDQFDLIDM